jgi:hypothetical protein
VRVEGARRRTRRRRRNLALAVLCLALLAVPAAALRSGHGAERHLDVAADGVATDPAALADDQSVPPAIDPVPTSLPSVGDPSSPAPVAPGPTLPPAAVAPAVVPAPAPVPAATTGTTARTTTTGRVCHNSSDPACGQFRWDPPLGPNQPLVASFTKAPTTAVVGQPLIFEVVWSDGDAKLSQDRFTTDDTHVGTACSLVPRYGPWTPPAPVGGSGTLTYPTSFGQPGTYHVSVELGTGDPQGPVGDDCNPVYGNATSVETTITVTAAAG